MRLLASATLDLIADISSIATATATVIVFATKVPYRRLRFRKQQDARRDDPVARPQASPSIQHSYAHRSPSHVPVAAQLGRVSAPVRIFHDTPPKLTTEQETDLIERGLPERLVRNGNLDYASLTSGSMSNRIRNGCC